MNGNHLLPCLEEGTWSLRPSAESEVNKMKKQMYRMLKTLEKHGHETEETTLRAGVFSQCMSTLKLAMLGHLPHESRGCETLVAYGIDGMV